MKNLMKKPINILYIGNNLTNKSGYNSTIAVLSVLLNKNNNVKVVSNKINKLFRILDMCFTVIKNNHQTDYILIDTFSTSNFYYAFIVSQLARLFNVKYIPILHGGNLPFRLENSKVLSTLIFKNSYINVAPSNFLKSAFEKKGYRVKFIPNVLNISDYIFKERKQLKPNLLWVRAFDKIYNPIMAIEVLYRLKRMYPEAKLCMIGPFKDESHQNTLAKIEEYKLENCVELTGVMPKNEWLKKSEDFDIFINTTNFDNTPVSVMEAMALGLPVISTNVGGLPFLISDKKEGILVNKNDAKQMTKEIDNLIKNPLFALELTQNAQLKAESFDWQAIKQQWFDILK